MTNTEIQAVRLAERTWPALWAFAYPMHGRRLALVRALALRLWLAGFRVRLAWQGLW